MAKSSSQSYDVFSFRSSKLAYIIHLCSLVCVQGVLYAMLAIDIWLFTLSLQSLLSLIFIFRQRQFTHLSHLGNHDWVLTEKCLQSRSPTSSDSKKRFYYQSIKHHLTISHFIDHRLYIVIYFTPKSPVNSIVIWQDQLSDWQWKALKTRALLT